MQKQFSNGDRIVLSGTSITATVKNTYHNYLGCGVTVCAVMVDDTSMKSYNIDKLKMFDASTIVLLHVKQQVERAIDIIYANKCPMHPNSVIHWTHTVDAAIADDLIIDYMQTEYHWTPEFYDYYGQSRDNVGSLKH